MIVSVASSVAYVAASSSVCAVLAGLGNSFAAVYTATLTEPSSGRTPVITNRITGFIDVTGRSNATEEVEAGDDTVEPGDANCVA